MSNHEEIIKTLREISSLQKKIYFQNEGSIEYKFINNKIATLQEKKSLRNITKEQRDIYELIVKKQNYLTDLEINQRTDDYLKHDIYNTLKIEINSTIEELIKIVE